MVHPNRRGNFTRCATNLDLHRIAQVHTDKGSNNGSLSLCQRRHDPGPACWFRITPVGIFSLAQQGDKRDVTLHHKSNNPIPDGVISLWSDCCPMSMLVWTQTVVPWRDPGSLVCPRVLHSTRRWSRFFGKHTSSGVILQRPNPRPCGGTHLRPAH